MKFLENGSRPQPPTSHVVTVYWHYDCFYCTGHVRAAICHLPLVLHLYLEFLSFCQYTFADVFFDNVICFW